MLGYVDLEDRGNPFGRALGYQRRLLLQPKKSEDLIFYIALCIVDCKFDEAQHWLDICLQRWPDDPRAQHQQAILWLMNGEYERGLRLYECRFKAYSDNYRGPPLPPWDGQPTDKPVIIWQEGGFGDVMLPARYLPRLAKICPNAQLFTDPSIRSLLRYSGLLIGIREKNDIDGEGYQCSIFSLLNMFEVTPDNISGAPYLQVPDGLVRAWRKKLRGQAKIGFCWSGNPTWERDVLRSMPLDKAQALASVIHVMLLDQQNTKAGDWADTAAIIMNLDLVITTCTSIAHCAGALGKPVWILLSKDSDWRWGRDFSYSHWYASATLFRQPKHGDWDSVIGEVYHYLKSGLPLSLVHP
jgi:hypothetical protein